MLYDAECARQVLAGVVPVGLPLSNVTAGPSDHRPSEAAISWQWYDSTVVGTSYVRPVWCIWADHAQTWYMGWYEKAVW